jgi:predicted RNase H-like nuclease (RuvC/YqgF family)
MDFDIAFGPNWKTNYIVETEPVVNEMTFNTMILHAVFAGAATFMVIATIYMMNEDEIRDKQKSRIKQLEETVQALEAEVEVLEEKNLDLAEENGALKANVVELEDEVSELLDRFRSKRKKVNPLKEDTTEAS